MIPLALIVNLWLGLLFAGCARHPFRAGEPPWRAPVLTLVSFEIIVFWPVALYFQYVHGDWTWLYTRPGADHMAWPLVGVVLFADLASLCIGYVVGWVLVRRQLERALLGGLAGLPAVAVLLVALLHRRLLRYGSYEDFHGGRALSIDDSKVPWVLSVGALGIAIAAGAVGWTLWSASRRPAAARDAATPAPTPSSAGGSPPTVSGEIPSRSDPESAPPVAE